VIWHCQTYNLFLTSLSAQRVLPPTPPLPSCISSNDHLLAPATCHCPAVPDAPTNDHRRHQVIASCLPCSPLPLALHCQPPPLPPLSSAVSPLLPLVNRLPPNDCLLSALFPITFGSPLSTPSSDAPLICCVTTVASSPPHAFLFIFRFHFPLAWLLVTTSSH